MKLALIGAGRIGKVHAQAIYSHPNVTLAAVADFHQPAAEAFAEQYARRAVSVACRTRGQGGSMRKAHRPGFSPHARCSAGTQ